MGKATVAASTKAVTKPKKEPFNWENFISDLVGKFGITGGTITVLLITFVMVITPEQKREAFNLYFLFKGGNAYPVFIGLILITILVVQNKYYRDRDKLKNQRIRELEDNMNTLQQHLMSIAPKKPTKP